MSESIRAAIIFQASDTAGSFRPAPFIHIGHPAPGKVARPGKIAPHFLFGQTE
ncbi:MAG: hypothetical protein WCI71_14005 [Bacteroidota bacterium]